MDPQERYESPLSSRYASPEMSALASSKRRITNFRRLWIALAKAQKTLGLPITDLQIAEMEKGIHLIDWEAVKTHEKRVRHDVMAHILAYSDQCPLAAPIVHLGATSCYVTDNADLLFLRDGTTLLLQKLTHLLRLLAKLSHLHASDPCLAYTHYQPAQPTTIGKRIALWLQDFLIDAKALHAAIQTLPFLGAKGATGTQASFLSLFHGDEKKVIELDRLIAASFGFSPIFLSGQTYTRKIDQNLLNLLASFASSAHKMATDLRLLAHDREMFEAFSETQVGSSAMPYKQNPVLSERVCSLARFLISLSQNPAYTAATQWLERSLDDSANRRLTLSEALLTTDALLNLLIHITSHLTINQRESLRKVEEHLPDLVTETLLMQAVERGGNRQQAHETLRKLRGQPIEKLTQALNLPSYTPQIAVGLAPLQVKRFLEEELEPALAHLPQGTPELRAVEY